jgi:hypothetical protein
VTPEQVEKVLAVLRAGTTPGIARAAAGVTVEEFEEWTTGDGEQLVEQARAEYEAKLVTRVTLEATRNWTAAAWLLERGFPARWARLSQREKADEPGPAAETDPFAEVDELAERRKRS